MDFILFVITLLICFFYLISDYLGFDSKKCPYLHLDITNGETGTSLEKYTITFRIVCQQLFLKNIATDYYLSAISPRHFQKRSLPFDIITISKLRILSMEYPAQSTHIAIRNARIPHLNIVSSFIYGRFIDLRRLFHLLHPLIWRPCRYRSLYSMLISRISFLPSI